MEFIKRYCSWIFAVKVVDSVAVSEEEEIMWISLHKLQDDAKMAELLYIKWEGGWIRTECRC